ncbi:class I SAM-dependent methyltransferase [Streptomyces sp. NPDC003280]|uniref:class I SAM-dependent methyltransferase n=1 Tax=Streptomyces sp. NPDC003280 TaxID=3364680 RepID=UPI0036999CC5
MHAIVNTAQAQAWNGYEGAHWAAHQDRWDAVNAGFDQPLLDAAVITPGDHVLDIGCGAGATTLLAARAAAPHGSALGLDLSGPMLQRARAGAEGADFANVRFEQGDAQVHPLPRSTFDVVISRFGIMFFSDPAAAFANIAAALRPGGRAALLKQAGFQNVRTEHVTAYGSWGHTAAEAADFLLDSGPGRHLLTQTTPSTAARAQARLTDALRPHEGDAGLRLRSTGWLLTATTPEA